MPFCPFSCERVLPHFLERSTFAFGNFRQHPSGAKFAVIAGIRHVAPFGWGGGGAKCGRRAHSQSARCSLARWPMSADLQGCLVGLPSVEKKTFEGELEILYEQPRFFPQTRLRARARVAADELKGKAADADAPSSS